MNDLSDTIHSRKKQLNALKEKLRSLNMNAEKSRNEIKKIQQEIFGMQEEIKKLEKQYTDISGYLKTPGNGALVVKNYVYPKVRVTIQNQVLEIMKTEYRPTYVLKEGLIQAI
ncbi:FapA family protein [Thermoclostridium stercorarium]|nr:FapA family protein [Thermoclostridium stercorarium]UZQ86110.1 FapA family protein [Thermoclostridium stercorarium]